MKLNQSIVKIIERMLNLVDQRLMDHGRRVAYLMYRALRKREGFDPEQIQRYCLLGLLHDIGAYKTEEIDNMVEFETETVWDHSVYGYLFIKYFSPLRDMAPAILFHHAGCAELDHLHPSYRELTQMIHVADRFDILSQTQNLSEADFRAHFEQQKNGKFDPHVVDMFFHDEWPFLFDQLKTDEEFNRVLYKSDFTDREVFSFVTMLVLSIDFRSPQTVTHTFTSSCVSAAVARLMGMDEDEVQDVFTGAMLHDLGKVGIPYHIIEKAGRLDEDEMAVMRNHVTITRDILQGLVNERILDLAVRHHERLDGSGYPDGLSGDQVTAGQRVIAVADIFSALSTTRSYKPAYPKERVIAILSKMSVEGTLDPAVVNVAVENYDFIHEQVEATAQPVIESYESMQAENAELLEQARTFCSSPGHGQIRW